MAQTTTIVTREEGILEAIMTSDTRRLISIVGPDTVDRPLDACGNTALHVAVIARKIPIIRALLSIGASVTSKNVFRETPRTIACRYSVAELFDVEREHLQKERDDFARQYDDAKREKKSLEKTVENYKNALVASSAKLSEANCHVASLKRRLNDSEEQYKVMLKRLKVSQDENKALQEKTEIAERQGAFYKESFETLVKKQTKR